MRLVGTCALLAGLFALPAVGRAQDATASAATHRADPAYWEFQVTSTVKPLSGRAPAYPAEMLEAHIDGRVLVQFVVDTGGVPEMRTFKVIESSNAMFSAAVREAVPSLRFVPATLEGRRVRQVVQQPFTFAVQ